MSFHNLIGKRKGKMRRNTDVSFSPVERAKLNSPIIYAIIFGNSCFYCSCKTERNEYYFIILFEHRFRESNASQLSEDGASQVYQGR